MLESYKINLVNASTFLFGGMACFISIYLTLGIFETTVLIPTVLGMLLFVMTPSMRNDNELVTKVVYGLTVIFGIMVAIMLVRELGYDPSSKRKVFLFGTMTFSSFICFAMYVRVMMYERALR